MSLTALLAKAELQIAELNDKNPATRTYGHMWAGLEMTLAQATATLEQEQVTVVRVPA